MNIDNLGIGELKWTVMGEFNSDIHIHICVYIYLWASLIICLKCRRHRRRGFDPWAGKIPWRRAWEPTPGFLPGEIHGQRSLEGHSPQGGKEFERPEVN